MCLDLTTDIMRILAQPTHVCSVEILKSIQKDCKAPKWQVHSGTVGGMKSEMAYENST